MKHKLIILVPLLFLTIGFANPVIRHVYNDWIEVEYYQEYPKGSVNRHNLSNIPDEYLLAMVAIHECINICPEDTKYIQEATWNRVQVNWGNYGKLTDQLKSSEFKGLLDSNFYFNPENKKHIFALKSAKRVIKGEREITKKRIFGWISHHDTDTIFLKKVHNKIIVTPTWHQFWYK